MNILIFDALTIILRHSSRLIHVLTLYSAHRTYLKTSLRLMPPPRLLVASLTNPVHASVSHWSSSMRRTYALNLIRRFNQQEEGAREDNGTLAFTLSWSLHAHVYQQASKTYHGDTIRPGQGQPRHAMSRQA